MSGRSDIHLQDITSIPMLAGADGIAKFARFYVFFFFLGGGV